MENWALMLAQTEATEQPTATETTTTESGDQSEQPQTKKKPGFLDGMGFPLILMFVVMYFLLFRGPKKKQKQHKEMLDGMKKNDRVRTIGGVLGTIVEVRENEVILKVDETNNTKIRLARNAVSQVIVDSQESK